MEELFQLILKSYGIAGILILAPFVGLIYLWKQNQKLHATLLLVHEKRVEDAQKVSERLITMVGEQSSLNKETNLALERLSDLMSYMQSLVRPTTQG